MKYITLILAAIFMVGCTTAEKVANANSRAAKDWQDLHSYVAPMFQAAPTYHIHEAANTLESEVVVDEEGNEETIYFTYEFEGKEYKLPLTPNMPLLVLGNLELNQVQEITIGAATGGSQDAEGGENTGNQSTEGSKTDAELKLPLP